MNLENISETVEELLSFSRELGQSCKEGKIKGPVHFSLGNEEQLVKIFRGLRSGEYITSSQRENGYSREDMISKKKIEIYDDVKADHPVFRGIKKGDRIFISYRNHPHALLRGIPREWLKETVLDGRSMYPINKEYNFVTSAIVPGHLPIAVGAALGMKLKKEPYHVWAFCGDMAAETGSFEQCSKYANNFNLSITFVIEDNGKSVDTPTLPVWGGQSPLRRPNTIRYVYELGVPHQGVGKEVGF